jgi:hypothetical protein
MEGVIMFGLSENRIKLMELAINDSKHFALIHKAVAQRAPEITEEEVLLLSLRNTILFGSNENGQVENHSIF